MVTRNWIRPLVFTVLYIFVTLFNPPTSPLAQRTLPWIRPWLELCRCLLNCGAEKRSKAFLFRFLLSTVLTSYYWYRIQTTYCTLDIKKTWEGTIHDFVRFWCITMAQTKNFFSYLNQEIWFGYPTFSFVKQIPRQSPWCWVCAGRKWTPWSVRSKKKLKGSWPRRWDA